MKRYKLRIPVPAGRLETVIDDPETERRGLLLVAHWSHTRTPCMAAASTTRW